VTILKTCTSVDAGRNIRDLSYPIRHHVIVLPGYAQNASDVTGLVEVLVGWLATLPKSQPVGAFFGLQLAGYRKSRPTG